MVVDVVVIVVVAAGCWLFAAGCWLLGVVTEYTSGYFVFAWLVLTQYCRKPFCVDRSAGLTTAPHKLSLFLHQ